MIKANLYLHPDAFVYNKQDEEEKVAKKFCKMINDMIDISLSPDKEYNQFFSSTELINCEVFTNTSIVDFAEKHLDNDAKGIFYTILGNTSADLDKKSLDDLKAICQYRPDETEVHSLLVLNASPSERKLTEYITFDNYELVYEKSSWLTLRRQILGNHPGTPSEFIEECSKYFDRLVLHNHCIDSLNADYNYLQIIPRKIVYYLSCLNDGFIDVYKKYADASANIDVVLQDFSGKYGLEKAGSRDGNTSKKENLKFEFTIKKQQVKLLCDPHLKITSADSNYAGSNSLNCFNPRIYFYPFKCSNEDGKIYVGSMGKHR